MNALDPSDRTIDFYDSLEESRGVNDNTMGASELELEMIQNP